MQQGDATNFKNNYLFFKNNKIIGNETIYISIPYTPEVRPYTEIPVLLLKIILPIVIPTVAFCMLDSMAIVLAILLSTLKVSVYNIQLLA